MLGFVTAIALVGFSPQAHDLALTIVYTVESWLA